MRFAPLFGLAHDLKSLFLGFTQAFWKLSLGQVKIHGWARPSRVQTFSNFFWRSACSRVSAADIIIQQTRQKIAKAIV